MRQKTTTIHAVREKRKEKEMNEIKHSFRIMIIDIEKDKVVIDEFADAIVGGIAKNVMPGEDVACAEIAVTRATTPTLTAAIMTAEGIIQKQKKMIIDNIAKEAGISLEELATGLMGKIFGNMMGEEEE